MATLLEDIAKKAYDLAKPLSPKFTGEIVYLRPDATAGVIKIVNGLVVGYEPPYVPVKVSSGS